MLQRYKDELAQIKARMIGAEKFAEKLPLFRDKILDEKCTSTDD